MSDKLDIVSYDSAYAVIERYFAWSILFEGVANELGRTDKLEEIRTALLWGSRVRWTGEDVDLDAVTMKILAVLKT